MASKANKTEADSAVQVAYNLANTANSLANSLDNTTVKLAGTQSITGQKTFSALRINEDNMQLGINSSTSGNRSIAVGYRAEAVGQEALAIGADAKCYTNYCAALGPGATVESTQTITVQLGSISVGVLRCRVNLTATSDIRDKADISTIKRALDFISLVKPIQYVDNQRAKYLPSEEERTEEQNELIRKYGLCRCYDEEAHAAGELKGQRKRVGVSAQQVQDALRAVYGTADYANLVNDNLHDVREREELPEGVESQLTVAYTEFVPFLIQAVQELAVRVKRLEDNALLTSSHS